MTKALHVALRELWTTVTSKGFLIGMLFVPLLTAGMVLILPRLVNEQAPPVTGDILLIDKTARIADVAARRFETRVARVPGVRLSLKHAPLAELERQKQMLARESGLLAVAVIDADAVEPRTASAGYGSYELFVRHKLDDRVQRLFEEAIEEAIVQVRAARRGLDADGIRELVSVQAREARTITTAGERGAQPIFHAVLPAAFVALLFLAVMVSGQSLMTTTIEEKSSRVMEVLLSAVSPLELMTGKIVGQLAVGLLLLCVYGAMGLAALSKYDLLILLDPLLLVYLFLFFLIAYFIVASLMAAIGAAVSDLRDAQGLFTPVLLVLMAPWLLWAPISRDPNSLLSVVMSFVPPVSSFAMLLRVASTSPPPTWQIWLSVAVGTVSVCAALWFAAKVFRIALLLHGKPPTFATLLSWLRQG